MTRKRIIGKCALCGQRCALTYEHIPPRMAFNSASVRQVVGFELLKDSERVPWDMDGLRYDEHQQGSGKYSLCGACNNNTGSWYAGAYINFASAVATMLYHPGINDAQSVVFKNLYPQRILKQVLSMFCSVNFEHPSSQLDGVRSYVLNRDNKYLDTSKYRISMYFTKSPLGKQIGMSVVGNIHSQTFYAVNEITAAPLGFLLYVDPVEVNNDGCIDVSYFSSYSYDDSCDIEFPIVIKEINSWIPADFRTKEEIEREIRQNIEGQSDGRL